MGNGMEDGLFDGVGIALVACPILERGEGSGKNKKAGQQDPREEGGKDIMQPGNLVQVEEHADIASLRRGRPRQELRPLKGSRGVWGCLWFHGDGLLA